MYSIVDIQLLANVINRYSIQIVAGRRILLLLVLKAPFDILETSFFHGRQFLERRGRKVQIVLLAASASIHHCHHHRLALVGGLDLLAAVRVVIGVASSLLVIHRVGNGHNHIRVTVRLAARAQARLIVGTIALVVVAEVGEGKQPPLGCVRCHRGGTWRRRRRGSRSGLRGGRRHLTLGKLLSAKTLAVGRAPHAFVDIHAVRTTAHSSRRKRQNSEQKCDEDRLRKHRYFEGERWEEKKLVPRFKAWLPA